MTTYRIIDKATGRTVHAYSAEAVTEFAEYPLADFAHVAEVVVREDGSIDADTSWHITKLAFRQRFTPEEKAAIEIASLDNPAAPMAQRALAASLRANQQDIQAATFIDLQRPDTAAGVRALETFGLIAAGRADQILTTPPTAEELYRG